VATKAAKGPRKLAVDMDSHAGLRGIAAVYIVLYHCIEKVKGSVIDLQVRDGTSSIRSTCSSTLLPLSSLATGSRRFAAT
jgi:hypothetical protein